MTRITVLYIKTGVVYIDISLNSSNGNYFIQNCRENQYTHFILNAFPPQLIT